MEMMHKLGHGLEVVANDIFMHDGCSEFIVTGANMVFGLRALYTIR